ncbi:MAG: ABC transporter ATP-binding protein [Alphaproteobacteria bacterium]
MATVELQGVSKFYGNIVAASDVTFSAASGSFVSLLGPSGCGKTTTLRMITGFEEPNAGEIRIDGERQNDVKPWRRDLGVVFQNYALFPFLTVFENVAFGLRRRGASRSEIESKVPSILNLVGLPGRENDMPRQLSGGQQQRVALARALAIEPRLLLLDEPLSALDAKLRAEMRFELKRIQQETGVTSIFVTHDQEEALTLSDQIVVMNEGRIAAVGTPKDIWERPGSAFVADFLGVENIFDLDDRDGNSLSFGGLKLPRQADAVLPDGPISIGLRSTDLLVGGGDDQLSMRAVVRQRSYRGSINTYIVDAATLPRNIYVSCPDEFEQGEEITLTPRAEAVMILRKDFEPAGPNS